MLCRFIFLYFDFLVVVDLRIFYSLARGYESKLQDKMLQYHACTLSQKTDTEGLQGELFVPGRAGFDLSIFVETEIFPFLLVLVRLLIAVWGLQPCQPLGRLDE